MYEYVYYWYDHMSRNIIPTIINSISDSIKNKDYNSFMIYYKSKLNHTYYDLFDEITVFQNDEIVDSISIEKEENFKKITYNEYECG